MRSHAIAALLLVSSAATAQSRDSACVQPATPDSLTAAFTVQVTLYNQRRPIPEPYLAKFASEFGTRLKVPEPLVLSTYVAPVWIDAQKDWTRGFAGLFAMLGISLEDRRVTSRLLVSTAVPGFDQALLDAVRSMESDSAVPMLPLELRRGKHELRLLVNTVQEVDSGVPVFRLRVPLVRFAAPARPQVVTHGGLRYPRELRRANMQGNVVMQFVIDESGEPLEQSLLVRQATHPQFAQSASSYVRQSRFQPALIGSCPVAVIVTQEFNFTIARAP